MTLKQRHLLTKHTYEIVDDGIVVRQKKPLSSHKYKIPFENVAYDGYETESSSTSWFVALIILWLLSLMTLIGLLLGKDVDPTAPVFWGVLALIATLAFKISIKSYIVFALSYASSNFFLFKNKPSKEVVEAFLKEVNGAKLKYITQHYLLGADNIEKMDFLVKLSSLCARGVIRKSELNELLKSYDEHVREID